MLTAKQLELSLEVKQLKGVLEIAILDVAAPLIDNAEALNIPYGRAKLLKDNLNASLGCVNEVLRHCKHLV